MDGALMEWLEHRDVERPQQTLRGSPGSPTVATLLAGYRRKPGGFCMRLG
jgi:hypothetical protein